MRWRVSTMCSLLLWAIASGCNSTSNRPLQTVERVDLGRYIGKWYEVARYPNRFEEGCVGPTAEYRLREDGKVDVINCCYDESFERPVRSIEGVAKVVDKNSFARLKVTFFWPFAGDYWIIDLDPEYQWAVVGEPARKYLWILSRTPAMDEDTFRSILSRLPDKGYDPARLLKPPQPVGMR